MRAFSPTPSLPPGPGLAGWVGHRVREAGVHVQRLTQRGGANTPRCVIFASSDAWEGSSKLRAFEVAPVLRKLGWRVTVVPKHLEVSQRVRLLAAEKPNVLLIQKGRNPTHFPHFYEGALAAGTRLVFDLDDADYVSADQAVQCEVLCRRAVLVTAGSHNVATWCRQFSPRVEVLWTGTPATGLAVPSAASQRGPILTWAQMSPLKYKQEAAFVLDVLETIADKAAFTFRLYGVEDEAAAADYFARVRERGVQVQLKPFMGYEQFIASLRECAVGMHVLGTTSKFAEGKSFGKVLAYLSAGVPTIASNVHENPYFFRHEENGLLCNTREEWAAACLALLTKPALRDQLCKQAWSDFIAKLSIDAIGARLDGLLREVVRTGAGEGKGTGSGERGRRAQ